MTERGARLASIAPAVCAALAAPASAHAQGPRPAPVRPSAQTPPAAAQSPAAAAGRLTIAAERVGGRRRPVLQGERWRVRGAGRDDARTARAVLAFRKVAGLGRTLIASPQVFRHLARGGGRFHVRFPTHGKHVEADLSRQVLALVRGRRVERIFPTSSGAPATLTVRGSFRVYLKTPGANAKGMVHSRYFVRGYAIHGYASVPVYPASHGCLRVPVAEALSIFRWLAYGDRVDVYA